MPHQVTKYAEGKEIAVSDPLRWRHMQLPLRDRVWPILKMLEPTIS